MRRYIFIVMLFLVSQCGLQGSPAFAERPDRAAGGICVSLTYGMELLDASVPDLMFRTFDGENARRMVKLYNNTDPKTEFKADHVYVITSIKAKLASIAIARGDCIVDAMTTSPENTVKFIATAMKDQT